MSEKFEIIAFYGFQEMAKVGALPDIKHDLRRALVDLDVGGTIIIADEGYNGMVSASSDRLVTFRHRVGKILNTDLVVKSSFHHSPPFRRQEVKIKREIVTLKYSVDISLGAGTHVRPAEWNALISDPETLVLDARNAYEYETGTFLGAVNPGVNAFSELPAYVDQELDPRTHRRVAMFCTGGIRCEKFAPYMKQLGFSEVYQLEGGILRYLEEVAPDNSLWEGECFVFDERISVNASLHKGSAADHSQRIQQRKNPRYRDTE
jgi:UPF0176 protein